MSVSFLPSIDVAAYSTEERGLSLKALSYFTNVHVALNPDNIEHAPSYLRETIGLYETHFDVTAIESLDDIVSLLDSGAAKAFVTLKQLEQLIKAGVEESRLVRSVDGKHAASFQNTLAMAEHPVHFRDVEHADELALAIRLTQKDSHKHTLIYVTLRNPVESSSLGLSKVEAIPIVPATMLTLYTDKNPDLISAPDLLLANAQTDRPDELYPTVVTDERGTTLGLVYSSKESIVESLRTGRGVYNSRKRGLWRKGETSGDIQELINIRFDCDYDTLCFMVRQKGRETTCFGPYHGLSKLQQTLKARKRLAPEGSYTARLFSDSELLNAKIMEEASELCEAKTKEDISWEAADLLFFALTKCIAAGVSLDDVELNLDVKSVKIKRRKGDAKPPFSATASVLQSPDPSQPNPLTKVLPAVRSSDDSQGTGDKEISESKAEDTGKTSEARIKMKRYDTKQDSRHVITAALQRPSQKSTEKIMGIVNPIINDVRKRGDVAVLEYSHKFDKATSLKSPVLKAPFPKELMDIPQDTIKAIDVAFENIRKFHAAQRDTGELRVETMPGVVCSRFSRPIERVGLYVPGGTAVLPSTALMLGVPAMVAGCKTIVFATPPRPDGSITPEVVYVASKVGAESICLAGGAQAVAALAFGTESISKVDKILGPGNQFVTAAKMVVSNDTSANVSIDMPAGPSEVLVVADKTSNPAFVASDLLSQAEHGADSQVVLIAVDLTEKQLSAIEDELHTQALALPRVDIVRGAIEHSVTLCVSDAKEALTLSNLYAPEHLILQTENAVEDAKLVEHAGSVFIGPWTPESVGDYSAGVNHSLPTYGYARMYSGVNLSSYIKHITSSQLTPEGLRNVSQSVMRLAEVEKLEAHRRAVEIRLQYLDAQE